MKSKQLILLSSAFLVLFGIAFVVSYLNQQKEEFREPEKAVKVTATPVPTVHIDQVPGVQKGDAGYKEPVHTVEVGSEEVSSGTFNSVENGKILFTRSSGLVALPLTSDEVVISCTKQNLQGVAELDFNQVVSVSVVKPSEVAGKIPAQEYIVVFADKLNGVYTAHTIAMADSSCKK